MEQFSFLNDNSPEADHDWSTYPLPPKVTPQKHGFHFRPEKKKPMVNQPEKHGRLSAELDGGFRSKLSINY